MNHTKRLLKTYAVVAADNLVLLLGGEALVQVRLVNGRVKEVKLPLNLVETLANGLPAFAVAVATLEALDVVVELVGPLGQAEELAAHELDGQLVGPDMRVPVLVLVHVLVLVLMLPNVRLSLDEVLDRAQTLVEVLVVKLLGVIPGKCRGEHCQRSRGKREETHDVLTGAKRVSSE